LARPPIPLIESADTWVGGREHVVRSRVTHIALFTGAVLAVLAVAAPAMAGPRGVAYLDPGTGSYMFQVVVGALLGVAVSVKLMWKRTWARLTRRSTREPQDKDA